MAVLSTIKCEICHKSVSVPHSASSPAPDICGKCKGEQEENKLQNYLQELSKLTIEQRLARIEEQLYYLSQRNDRDDWDRLIG